MASKPWQRTISFTQQKHVIQYASHFVQSGQVVPIMCYRLFTEHVPPHTHEDCKLLTTRAVILYRHWILKYSQWSHSKTVFLEYPPPTNSWHVNGTTPRAIKPALRRGCPPASPLTLHLLASSFICSCLLCLPMHFLRMFWCLSRYIFLLFHCNSFTHFTSLAILKHETTRYRAARECKQCAWRPVSQCHRRTVTRVDPSRDAWLDTAPHIAEHNAIQLAARSVIPKELDRPHAAFQIRALDSTTRVQYQVLQPPFTLSAYHIYTIVDTALRRVQPLAKVFLWRINVFMQRPPAFFQPVC
jgi:hypothetical protein